MIICLYHGSSFKEVNETQTAAITNSVIAAFPNQEVIAAYYSSHVQAIMERRGTPLLGIKQAIEDNYHHDNIYILVTNMMNGEEYQNVLKTINQVDPEHKVKHTNYLLDKTNIYNIAEAVVDKDTPTLFIGHGNTIDNSDYQMLNQILEVDGNFVTTLKSDVEAVLNQHFYNKHLNIRPLMITSAYHAKKDIEVDINQICVDLGYKPTTLLSPLATNTKVQQMLIDNLQQLIEEN